MSISSLAIFSLIIPYITKAKKTKPGNSVILNIISHEITVPSGWCVFVWLELGLYSLSSHYLQIFVFWTITRSVHKKNISKMYISDEIWGSPHTYTLQISNILSTYSTAWTRFQIAPFMYNSYNPALRIRFSYDYSKLFQRFTTPYRLIANLSVCSLSLFLSFCPKCVLAVILWVKTGRQSVSEHLCSKSKKNLRCYISLEQSLEDLLAKHRRNTDKRQWRHKGN